MTVLPRLIVSSAFRELCQTWLADPEFYEQPRTVAEISAALMLYLEAEFNALYGEARQMVRHDKKKKSKKKIYLRPPPQNLNFDYFVLDFRERTSNACSIYSWLGDFATDKFQIATIAETDDCKELVIKRAKQIIESLKKEHIRGPPPAQCMNYPRGICKTPPGQPLQFRTDAEGLWNDTCSLCGKKYRGVCFFRITFISQYILMIEC
jgi:hypothetical protein